MTRQDDSLNNSNQTFGDIQDYFLWSKTSQTLSQFDFPVREDFERYTSIWTEQRFLIHHYSKYLKFNVYYKIVYIFALVFGLYGFNIFELCFDSRSTIPFDILNAFCLLMYLVNIVLTLLGSIDYFNSFYYYIDILSSIIIFFDFNWLLDIFFSQTINTNYLQIRRIYLFLEILRLV